MNVQKNPAYLRGLIDYVEEFRVALQSFLELHVINDGSLNRGLLPAVWPKEGIDAKDIAAATDAVSVASGRALAAANVTNVHMTIKGFGVLNPISSWHSMTLPKPLLEPGDVLSACGQIKGRLDGMLLEAEAMNPPEFGADALHPLIWAPAKRLWQNDHYRQAVAASAEALISHVKLLTGRNDVAETSLWQQAFSEAPATPSSPRLRWPGNPKDRDVKTMNDGLRFFAPGVQMTVRNSAAHGNEEMGKQDALERMAALSLLARWVEQCSLDSGESA